MLWVCCFLPCLAFISATANANKRQVGNVFSNFVHPASRFDREFDGGILFKSLLDDPQASRMSLECLDKTNPRCKSTEHSGTTFLTDQEGGPLGPGFPPKSVRIQVSPNISTEVRYPAPTQQSRFLVGNVPPLPSPPLRRRPVPKGIAQARNSPSRSEEREVDSEEKPQSRVLRPLFYEDLEAPENSKQSPENSEADYREEYDDNEAYSNEEKGNNSEETDEHYKHRKPHHSEEDGNSKTDDSEEEHEEDRRTPTENDEGSDELNLHSEENPEHSSEEAENPHNLDDEENSNVAESEDKDKSNSEEDASVSQEEKERPILDYSELEEDGETNLESDSQEGIPNEEHPEEEHKQEVQTVKNGSPQYNVSQQVPESSPSYSNDKKPSAPLNSIEDNGATLSNSEEEEGEMENSQQSEEDSRSEEEGEEEEEKDEEEERPSSDYLEENNRVNSSGEFVDYDEGSNKERSEESDEDAPRPVPSSTESSSEEAPSEDYDSQESGPQKPNESEERPSDYLDYGSVSFHPEGGDGDPEQGQRPQTADILPIPPTYTSVTEGPKGEEQDVNKVPVHTGSEKNKLNPPDEADSSTPSAEDPPSLEDDFSFGFDSFEVDPDVIKMPKPTKHFEDEDESATRCDDDDIGGQYGLKKLKKPLGTAKPKPPQPGDEVSITRDRPVLMKLRPGQITTTTKPVSISALGIVKPGGAIIARVVSPNLQVQGSTTASTTKSHDAQLEAPLKTVQVVRGATALTYLKPPPMDQSQTWFLRMPRASRLFDVLSKPIL